MAPEDGVGKRRGRWVALGLAAVAVAAAGVFAAFDLHRAPCKSGIRRLVLGEASAFDGARPGAALKTSGQPGARRRDEPMAVGGAVTHPRRIAGESPDLSKCRDQMRALQGAIILQGVIEKNGRLDRLGFLSPPPGGCIEKTLREALAAWRFHPALLHGKPVAVYYNLSVNVDLQ